MFYPFFMSVLSALTVAPLVESVAFAGFCNVLTYLTIIQRCFLSNCEA